MMTFDEWLGSYPVNVRDQSVISHMRQAYNAALNHSAYIAERERKANSGSDKIQRSAEASSELIGIRIRSFMDKKGKPL